MTIFDEETVNRLRRAQPREAYLEVKEAVYKTGSVASEDFLNAFEELVDAGVLSWEQIEEFERG